MPYRAGGPKGGGSAPRVTLDALAQSLLEGSSLLARSAGSAAKKARGQDKGDAPPALEVARWDVHPSVALVRFSSMAAQRDALARASTFLGACVPACLPPPLGDRTRAHRDSARAVKGSTRAGRSRGCGVRLRWAYSWLTRAAEDAARARTVVERLAVGRMGGAALYSGHNMRSSELCAFLDAAVAHPGGLAPAEVELKEALLAAGVLTPCPHSACGARAADERSGAVLAVASGAERGEVRGALLHEAMHGVWYVCESFRAEVESYYRETLRADERDAWLRFLGGLNYDCTNDELVINEFQAYMCTETVMWARGGGGSKSGKKKGASGDNDQLLSMQAAFNRHVGEAGCVPQPAPSVCRTRCMFET